MKEEISIYEDVLGVEALRYEKKDEGKGAKNQNADEEHPDIRNTVLRNFRRSQDDKNKLN